MNNLNTLLEDASADVPHDAFELDGVISVGRSRVRRRRAVAGLAVAAVVGLGAALVVPGSGGGGDNEPATPAQVRVMTLDDAVAAEPGRDYDVLGEFTAHSSDDAMTGDFVRAVLPDGTDVLQQYPNGIDGASKIALVAPDGGARSVEAPVDLGNYLGASETQLVFGTDADGLWLLDSATLRWREALRGQMLDGNVPAQPASQPEDGGGVIPRGGRPPRIYLPAAPAAGETARSLFEIDLAGGTSTELARGGVLAAADGLSAWTNAYDAPVAKVTVRAEGTTSFDPRTGDCVGKDIGINATRVVLMTNCSDQAGDNENTDVIDRIDIFGLDGTPVARITGDDFGPVRMTDRFLTISSWHAEQSGTYTYDLETGSFLRVTDAMSGLAGEETGTGSTLVWEKQLDGETGATYVVARMR